MIVDDEPFIVSGFKIVLQCITASSQTFDFQNQVDSACNGFIAFEKFKKKFSDGVFYSIIFMDCNMPKMDGYQSTQNIRKFIEDNGGQQPFIVGITGHSEPIYIERALQSGMNVVIKKPASINDVQNAIKHISL